MKNEDNSSAYSEVNRKKLRLQAAIRNLDDCLADAVLEGVELERDRSTLSTLKAAAIKVLKGALATLENESLFLKVNMLKMPTSSKDLKEREHIEPKEVTLQEVFERSREAHASKGNGKSAIEVEILDDSMRGNGFRLKP